MEIDLKVVFIKGCVELLIEATAIVGVRPGLFEDDLYCRELEITKADGPAGELNRFMHDREVHLIELERMAVTAALNQQWIFGSTEEKGL